MLGNSKISSSFMTASGHPLTDILAYSLVKLIYTVGCTTWSPAFTVLIALETYPSSLLFTPYEWTASYEPNNCEFCGPN